MMERGAEYALPPHWGGEDARAFGSHSEAMNKPVGRSPTAMRHKRSRKWEYGRIVTRPSVRDSWRMRIDSATATATGTSVPVCLLRPSTTPPEHRFNSGPAYESVAFGVRASGRHAYLLVRSVGGTSWELSQMQPSAEKGNWEVTLQLSPGTYQYRFYVDTSAATVLVPGWQGWPTGLHQECDAVIRVGPADSPAADLTTEPPARPDRHVDSTTN
jgi:hypothetical protein